MISMEQWTCPICQEVAVSGGPVGVYCGEDLAQPNRPFFLEIPSDVSYLANTRTYPPGERETFSAERSEGQIRISNNREKVEAVRLLERNMQMLSCCVRCKEDFVQMFGVWSRGGLKNGR